MGDNPGGAFGIPGAKGGQGGQVLFPASGSSCVNEAPTSSHFAEVLGDGARMSTKTETASSIHSITWVTGSARIVLHGSVLDVLDVAHLLRR